MKTTMQNLRIITVAGLIMTGCVNEKPMEYPDTRQEEIVDDYFGIKVADPYRWLENDTAAEVSRWVEAQNDLTSGYLARIPYRNAIRTRLEEMWNYPKYSAPFKKGDYYFYFQNDGLQNQYVLYYQKGLDGKPEVFIDPNQLSTDGTVALTGVYISGDHRFAAYTLAESGSDWVKIEVMEVATRRKVDDVIRWVKFSGASWRGDGFYYSRYDEPVKGKEYSGQNENQKIYYHKLGTSQSEDVLIFEDKTHPKRYFFAAVSEDERYVFLHASEGTSGTELHFLDVNNAAAGFRLLFKGFDYNYSLIDHIDGRFYVLTDHGAQRYHLVSVDPNKPAQDNWKIVVPEQKDLMESAVVVGSKLIVTYLKDANSRVVQYSLKGEFEHDIDLPTLGTATGFSGKRSDSESFYTFTSFTHPGDIYRYDLNSGKSALFRQSKINVDVSGFETKQVFFESKDGTKIPMFIVHRKDVKLDGHNPAFLYGYGGFNVNMTPMFSVKVVAMLEKGVVFAMPNLRGGGEYGEDWHKAGMLEKKQNVFDDFVAAAEYLIKNKYTAPSKLAISGGSNGGLLVGACMTQRPELFRVALPAVGVLDMLRYHKFTIGWGWVVEYGSSDDKEQFDYLIKYSPLHNLKKGTKYPATLVTTADHDDRVVPAHSFKFAAALQKLHTGPNPVLIRIETKAGHGFGMPTSKQIDESADIIAFMFQAMGYKELPN